MSSIRNDNWTDWTDWNWSPADNARYRARQNIRSGDFEYDFDYGHGPPVGEPTAPRGDSVDGLVDDFAHASIQDQPFGQYSSRGHQELSYGQNESYGQDTACGGNMAAYTWQSRPTGPATSTARSPYSTTPRQDYTAPPSKGKGKSTEVPAKHSKSRGLREKERDRDVAKEKAPSSKKHRPKPGKGQSEDPGDQSAATMEPFYRPGELGEGDGPNPGYEAEFRDPSQSVEPAVGSSPGEAVFSTGTGLETGYVPYQQGSSQSYADHDEAYNEQYAQQDHHGSRHAKSQKPGKQRKDQPAFNYPQPAPFTPPENPTEEQQHEDEYEALMAQADGYGTGDILDPGQPSSSMPSVADYSAPYGDHDEDEPGQQTPRATSPLAGGIAIRHYPASIITGDPLNTGSSEMLDQRYTVEPSSRFQPGEVFKILWSEPLGSGRNEHMTECEERSVLGEKFYISFRRFIIVASDEGHSSCIPILTYERRGCTKRGVKPRKHGIVYHLGGRPRMLENEPELGFVPVRLELDYQSEKLAKESRVNYSKLVTVEHNVKVFFIGRIVSADYPIVVAAVDKCWGEKIREQTQQRPIVHRQPRDHRDSRHRDRDRRR
ncbi:hypothetical protein QBC46DRAFT_118380 [Diplogelasinospora grovesii]|uniref:DUF6590 domain-containing protein n=1 Tax=Diplogelasinospora grovesii TaxID=303347 RepID=A0AAN6N7X3_9PEZI|nr:hypothetical protein QBC46DRAFT_118380 [Diplogelasinospora grovesii]